MGTIGNPDWSQGIDDPPIDDRPLSNGNIDPVKQYATGWYFWDEAWTDRFGPFETRNDAEKMLDRYCKECL